LPNDLDKILYLDADILVLDELTKLWTFPLDNKVGGCVQLRPTLAVSLDFAPEEIVLTHNTPAFNAGVMLIDLAQWRQKEIGKLSLHFAYKYKYQFKAWDQDALNCALVGSWEKLPARWNVRPDIFGFEPWKEGSYTLEEEKLALKAPGILHFAGETKPWLPFAKHPYKKLFFHYLSLTPWKDWELGGSYSSWLKETLVSYPTRKLNRLLEFAIKTKKAKVSYKKYRKHLLLTLLSYPWLLVVYPFQRNNLLKRWFSN
jgi:lipopolysaccharide biosynthesis glycosyltransferase